MSAAREKFLSDFVHGGHCRQWTFICSEHLSATDIGGLLFVLDTGGLLFVLVTELDTGAENFSIQNSATDCPPICRGTGMRSARNVEQVVT